MRKIATGIVLAACLSISAAMAAGWPERALSHDAAGDERHRASERMACEFAAATPGESSAAFTRGRCGAEDGRRTSAPADTTLALGVAERRIMLGEVRTESHTAMAAMMEAPGR